MFQFLIVHDTLPFPLLLFLGIIPIQRFEKFLVITFYTFYENRPQITVSGDQFCPNLVYSLQWNLFIKSNCATSLKPRQVSRNRLSNYFNSETSSLFIFGNSFLASRCFRRFSGSYISLYWCHAVKRWLWVSVRKSAIHVHIHDVNQEPRVIGAPASTHYEWVLENNIAASYVPDNR